MKKPHTLSVNIMNPPIPVNCLSGIPREQGTCKLNLKGKVPTHNIPKLDEIYNILFLISFYLYFQISEWF